MANASGHMSHHGAQGTVWTVVAPNELARLASLQLLATRQLRRVQVVGDRGLASNTFRDRIWDRGARPAIPPKRTDAPVACPPWIYANRHFVENLWARLKEGRAIATRYEKTAKSFLSVLSFATFDWLRG